ncbi:MAG: tRNA preQ1(34) S-adenosylmethionine ribosyltransferase-isomerase QueA [candidate division WOR-3 bacterium]
MLNDDLSLYDFDLPAERIAQYAGERGKSRLFAIKEDGSFAHGTFPDIVKYFVGGDLLIINNTKVIRARLIGQAHTGGRVEMLFTGAVDGKRFRALVRPGKRFKPGTNIKVGDATIRVVARNEREAELLIESGPGVMALLESHGQVPLPPYIKRPSEPGDELRYQTVFAEKPGSVAAPTAGLHFTEEILKKIKGKGVRILKITLHVGPGTFNPIRSPDLTQHEMEAEYYLVPDETAEAILETKRSRNRVFVCGTTCTRALETWAMGQGPKNGWTRLFIYPGHNFRVPDALITNFHLPRSTPLALVAAFCGRETALRAYAEALEKGYAFGSYGDAMLIIRPSKTY